MSKANGRNQIISSLGKIGVLYGGNSAEREISLQSGASVIAALSESGADVVDIDLRDQALEQIVSSGIEHAFIALHGPGGEDGRIQALLEFLDIPYTGSRVSASALCMDKIRTKQLWMGVGIATPAFLVLDRQMDWQAIIEKFGGQVIVKPSHEGSSIGMARAQSAEELSLAYSAAAKFDNEVLLEQFISGAEYTVAILNDQALPPIELITDHVFFDFDAKYISDQTEYICPSNLDKDKTEELKSLALSAFRSLGASGWGRVDVMADELGNFYVLEVNTVPGMTSHSLVPMAAKEAGMTFNELVVNIASQSL